MLGQAAKDTGNEMQWKFLFLVLGLSNTMKSFQKTNVQKPVK